MTRVLDKGLLSVAFAAFALMASTPALAKSHCTCNEECAAACKLGKNEKCTCKTCSCATGQGCSHNGKCGLKKTAAE